MPTALSAAVTDVVGRHESLRTVFSAVGGTPQQVVLPPRERPILGGKSSMRSDGRRPARVRPSRKRRATALTWRARSLCGQSFSASPSDEHVLVVVVHHIAADGWSIGPLAADVGVAYMSRRAGQAPAWAPLPVQYVDYTLWQRKNLVMWRIVTAPWPRRWSFGRTRWPGCPSGCNCLPIGPIRRWPITAAPA